MTWKLCSNAGFIYTPVLHTLCLDRIQLNILTQVVDLSDSIHRPQRGRGRLFWSIQMGWITILARRFLFPSANVTSHSDSRFGLIYFRPSKAEWSSPLRASVLFLLVKMWAHSPLWTCDKTRVHYRYNFISLKMCYLWQQLGQSDSRFNTDVLSAVSVYNILVLMILRPPGKRNARTSKGAITPARRAFIGKHRLGSVYQSPPDNVTISIIKVESLDYNRPRFNEETMAASAAPTLLKSIMMLGAGLFHRSL